MCVLRGLFILEAPINHWVISCLVLLLCLVLHAQFNYHPVFLKMTFSLNDSNNACLPIPSTFYDMLKFVRTINIAKHNGNNSIEYMKWDNSVSGLLIHLHIWLASAPQVFRTFIFSWKVIFQDKKKAANCHNLLERKQFACKQILRLFPKHWSLIKHETYLWQRNTRTFPNVSCNSNLL